MTTCTRTCVFLAALAGLLVPAGASKAGDWTDKIHLGGYLQSDLRYVIDEHRGPGGRHFEMNRNDVVLRLKVEPDPSVQGVIAGQARFFGFNHATDLGELTERRQLSRDRP